jgi:mRNA-degrading endonuclease YafQ of YafQ-DinJ toxin-antitoxin module
MAYTYKKEYARFIQEAKRDTTKLSRLKKVITNLEQNIKMHEQYKC